MTDEDAIAAVMLATATAPLAVPKVAAALASAPWRNPWMQAPPEPAGPPPPELLAKGVGKGKQPVPKPAPQEDRRPVKAPPPNVVRQREAEAASAAADVAELQQRYEALTLVGEPPAERPRLGLLFLERQRAEQAKGGGKGQSVEEPAVGTHIGTTPEGVIPVDLESSVEEEPPKRTRLSTTYQRGSSSAGSSAPAALTQSALVETEDIVYVKSATGYDSDKDDMISHATTNRTSVKSKMGCQKSAGTRMKRLMKIRQFRIDNGLPWQEEEHEYDERYRRITEVHENGVLITNPVEAAEKAKALKNEYDERHFTMQELMDLKLAYDTFFAPTWTTDPPQYAINSVLLRYIVDKEDPAWPGYSQKWCNLCGKYATGGARDRTGACTPSP